MRQSSKYNSVVGEPLMPIFFSLGPALNPSSSLCTMNAEIPLAPLSGSVTAISERDTLSPARKRKILGENAVRLFGAKSSIAEAMNSRAPA